MRVIYCKAVIKISPNDMTTNVRDSISGLFAADSRWSIDLRPEGLEAIVFVDSAAYSKILMTANLAYMFAGRSNVIDLWKAMIDVAERDGKLDWSLLPVNGMAVSVVGLADAQVKFEFGHEIRLPDASASEASFAGTGSVAACTCWTVNKDPRKAVETAKGSDIFTGGNVRYLEFLSKNNNLIADSSLITLQNAFAKEGMIMETKLGVASTPVPLKDALAKQGLAAALLKIESGELSPTAPCDAVYNNWPTKERNKLVAAMKLQYPKTR
jgi:hypothetical protein